MRSLVQQQHDQLKKDSAQFLKSRPKLAIMQHRQADKQENKQRARGRARKRKVGGGPTANALDDLHGTAKAM